MSAIESTSVSAVPDAAYFPWYDSYWLESYVRVKAYLRERQPGRLAEFEQACRVFETRPDFQSLELSRVFDDSVQARLRELVHGLREDEHEKHEALSFGRSVVHHHPLLTELHAGLVPRVSELVGEELEPSYNFLSLYNNLGLCQVHMDAPLAKWTLDYCIAQTAVWPLHVSQVRPWPDAPHRGDDWAARVMSDPDNRFTAHTMQPGEALIFSGSSQWHYRERIPRVTRHNQCQLAFFHFIPRGARALVWPPDWAELFGIPELAQLVCHWQNPNTQRLG